MSRLGPTLLSVGLVGVLTLAAYTDVVLVACAVVLVQVLVATAPGRLHHGAPLHSPGFMTAVVAGTVATVLTVAPGLLDGAAGTSAGVVGSTGTGTLAGVLPAVAVAVFVALVAQMARTGGRPYLVVSTSHAVTVAVLAALAVGWVGTVQSLGDAQAVAVGAGGLAAGLLVWAVPGDRWLMLGLAMLAGGGAGAAVVVAADTPMTWFFGVVVGSATAVFAVLGQVIGRAWSRGCTGPAAIWGYPGALSVALAAPIVYVGGQLITVPTL